MKKVININFHGTVIPIEETAYEILRQYVESLRNYFASEEGRDEIINDIESRISELFQERLKAGATCITDDDVNAIITNMGRPEDFDEAAIGEDERQGEKQSDEGAFSSWKYRSQKKLYRDEHNKILGGVCSGIAAFVGIDPWIVRILFILSGVGLIAYIILWIFLPVNTFPESTSTRRLYRNPDDRIIAGICGGIGSYFNINSWIPRIIFLLPFISFFFRWQHFGPLTFPNFIQFTFSPGTLVVYIILWLVIPEAKTTSEKLLMKGEKVDLNSIKESVAKEMQGVADKMEKMGKDASEYMKQKGPELKQELNQSVSRTGSVIGQIISTLIKVFLYIILGAVGFTVLVVLFAIAVAALAVFPFKNLVVTSGWQNILAWLTLIFFIGVPVIGTLVSIIRRLARRPSAPLYRNIGIGLWVFGWICLFAFLSVLGRDFSREAVAAERSVQLSNPKVESLEIRPLEKSSQISPQWFTLGDFMNFEYGDDTLYVQNVSLRIRKAEDDSFSVRYRAVSLGATKDAALQRANHVAYGGYQDSTVLYLENSIGINKHDKFRNQWVEVSVFVPLNHRIRVSEGFGSSGFVFFGNRGRSTWDRQWAGYGYEDGVDYVMREDGLHEVSESRRVDADGKYRYGGPGADSINTDPQEKIKSLERALDSTRDAQQKQMKKIQDSLLRQRQEIDKKLERMNPKTAVIEQLPQSPTAPDRFFSLI